jgi:S1-C subfamily serine protease
MLRRARSLRDQLREQLFGDERHIGLWIFPLFVMAALLGATLIGGLAVLYYAQQVRGLEETTAAAREQLDEAVEDVQRAAEKAQEDIDEQVGEARDEFSRRSPVQVPAEGGVYAVSAEHPDGSTRVASAFTVFSNNQETYLITTHRVAALEDGGVLPAVNVFLPEQTVALRVHNFDPDRDLAVLVAQGGPLPVLQWRPADQPVNLGDAIYAIGVAGPGTPTIVEGAVAGANETAIVPNLQLNSFLEGGPLIDAAGDVVAVASQTYAPFGLVPGTLRYAPPIRLICERLLDCTEADVGGLGDADG